MSKGGKRRGSSGGIFSGLGLNMKTAKLGGFALGILWLGNKLTEIASDASKKDSIGAKVAGVAGYKGPGVPS